MDSTPSVPTRKDQSIETGSVAISTSDRSTVLIDRFLKRDTDALGELYDQWVNHVYTYAFDLTGNKDIAEDRVEDTFWLAWEWSYSYDRALDNILGWILQITAKLEAQRRGVPAHEVAGEVDLFTHNIAEDSPPDRAINPGRSAGIRSRLISRAISTREGKISVVDIPGLEKPPLPSARRADKAAQKIPEMTPEKMAEKAPERVTEERWVGAVAADGRSDEGANSEDANSAEAMRAHVKTAFPAPSAGATKHVARQAFSRRGGAIWFVFGLVVAGLVGGVQEWRVREAAAGLSGEYRSATLTDSLMSGGSGEGGTSDGGSRGGGSNALSAYADSLLAERDSLISQLTSADTRVISLTRYGASGPLAKAFWDQEKGEWHLWVSQVRAPRSEHRFQVWVATNQYRDPILLGTFTPDADGRAYLKAIADIPPYAFTRMMISEEPDSGSPVPTGQIVLAGL